LPARATDTKERMARILEDILIVVVGGGVDVVVVVVVMVEWELSFELKVLIECVDDDVVMMRRRKELR